MTTGKFKMSIIIYQIRYSFTGPKRKTMKKFLLSAGKMLILTMVVLNSCKKEDAPTWEDMLTGGPTAKNGKTWVLSDKNYPAQDGAGDISPGMAIIKIFPD